MCRIRAGWSSRHVISLSSGEKMMRRVAVLWLLLVFTSSAWADSYFVTPNSIRLTMLLPPPPADGSAGTREELAELHRIQAEASPERVALAEADTTISVFRFADVFGPTFTPERLPRIAALFANMDADEWPISDAAKAGFPRTRPYLLAPDEVRPLVKKATGGSYPSGHMTVGTMMGIVLAWMVPERRDAIFARITQYGLSREVGGMHYPSDVAAGRIAGTIIAEALWSSPRFQAQYEPARTELRAAIGLAP
jgi:acid phosphatase (class A)